MILDDFSHQTGHSAANARDQVEDLFAASLTIKRSLDCLDLAPDAADTGEQLLLFPDSMGHAHI